MQTLPNFRLVATCAITLFIGLPLLHASGGQEKVAKASPPSQEAIDAAIDRGAQYLISQQDLDGSWRYDTPRHYGGMTGFAVYTLIKSGLPTNHNAVQRGLLFLDTVTAKTTYEAACMISAYASADPRRYAKRLQELTDLLVEWNNGSWAYPEGAHDISNTHFGALGLRHAQEVGCQISIDVWEDIAKSMIRWQEDDGAFLYHDGRDATLSMTAAGVGIACIAREALEKEQRKKKKNRTITELEEAIDRGIEWMALHDPVPHGAWEGNAPHPRWNYYYLYALQRVGVLTPRDTINEQPWYEDGARWLIQKQAKDGKWATAYGEGQANTCHAILFLKRASSPRTGEQKRPNGVVKVEDPEASVRIIANGQNPTRVWILGFHELVLDSWEWPGEEGMGPHVRKVEYWSGERLLAQVEGDPKVPAKNGHFAAQVQFSGLGQHPLRAKVYLEPPPGDPEPDPMVESPDVTILVDQGMLPWMREYAEARKHNLLHRTRVSVEATSQFNDKWKASQLIDGLQGRGWMCAADDELPGVTFDLRKAQSSNRIGLTVAVEGPGKIGKFAKPEVVRITVNKRKAFEVEIGMDPLVKTWIELPRKEKVRRLKLEIVKRRRGEQHDAVAGFMEVELGLAK